jgi:V/A-type H+-transporting ATPase subunit I
MFVPEKMKRLSVAVLRQDMEAVLEEIVEAGVLHLTRIEEIDEWAGELESMGVSRLSTEYVKRQRRLRSLIEQVAPTAFEKAGEEPSGRQDVGLMEVADIDREAATLEKHLGPVLEARGKLNEKLSELRRFKSQVETILPAGPELIGLERSTLLASAVGTVEEKNLPRLREALEGIPSTVVPFNREGKSIDIVAIVLKRDRQALGSALEGAGFKEIEVPEHLKRMPSDVTVKIDEEIAEVERKLDEVSAGLADSTKKTLPSLLGLLRKVEAAILLTRIKHYCRLTDKTCVFSGWVPEDRADELAARIRERAQGRVVVEIADAESIRKVREGKVEVPVLLKNPALLRPFQMLVSGYGLPSYNTLDPTLFVAVTFLLMFGMMFGDIGHGAILIAAGLILAFKSLRFGEIGRLVAACGMSSVLFGVLYGSLFGVENLISPVWVRPLDGISELFKFSIGFGIVVVSMGIVLNVINSVRTHSFVENFFDKSGPLVGIVYWSGIGIAVTFMMSSGRLPSPLIFFGLFIVPLGLFFMQGPIMRLLGKRRKAFPDGVGNYIMEGLVGILEILMGYLANTVSFIRVAAFGLAHAGLFVAVFSLAELVAAKPGGTLASWVVLILGNAVIILLEGLVVTIQALRLEYYEFFSKFFRPSTAEYKPAFMGKFVGTDNVKGGG